MDSTLGIDGRPPLIHVESPATPLNGIRERPASPESSADRVVVMLDLTQGRGLYGFVSRMGLSPEEAEDAVQEVLLRLWTALRGGLAITDPKAWAYRVIYRLAMDEHRWRRRITAIRGRLEGGSAFARSVETDAVSRVSIWAQVDRLPTRQREILYLRYRVDMTFEDAAKVMGITAGAARANATKAMKSLRESAGEREAWR